LRQQLHLPDEQGLLVESVMEGSPAAQAGIQRYDVLLAANGTPLKNVADLVGELNKGKDAKLSIDLIRGGERQTISATPQKRSEMTAPRAEVGQNAEDEELEDFLRMVPGLIDEGPLRFRVFHPAQILPPGAKVPGSSARDVTVTVKTEATLDDGYKLSIVRENQKPAKITVTRGDEKWEATETELGKLPEKVRSDVERLLHMGPLGLRMLVAPEATSPQTRSRGDSRMERRMEQMHRNMEQMQKAMNEMRGRMGQPPMEKMEKPAPKKPAPEKKPAPAEKRANGQDV